MCIAIAKPKNIEIPSENVLYQCWMNNPDGAGFSFAYEGKVFIKKGFMTWDSFLNSFNFWNQKLNFKKLGLLIHFRIATHGSVDKSMTHPFPIDSDEGALSKPEYVTDYAVVHNGIITLTSCKASRSHGLSDTAIFIKDYLSLISKNKDWFNNKSNIELIEKLIDSKMAILDSNGNIKMTNGFVEKDGIYYSNRTFEDNYYRFGLLNFPLKTSSTLNNKKKNNSKYKPLMKITPGSIIEYDGGIIDVTNSDSVMYYLSEYGELYSYYLEDVNNFESSLYEFMGYCTVYNANIQEISFKPDTYIPKKYFI